MKEVISLGVNGQTKNTCETITVFPWNDDYNKKWNHYQHNPRKNFNEKILESLNMLGLHVDVL